MTYTYPPGTIIEPRENRLPGVCRVCGCSDEEACVLAWDEVYTDAENLPEAIPAVVCHWVDPDLCSRCHGPGRPTRRQAFEIARLRAYKGRLRVLPAPRDGDLRVQLLAQGFDGAVTRHGLLKATAPPTVTMNAAGRVVRR